MTAGQAKSGQAESGQARSGQAESGQQTADAGPAQGRSWPAGGCQCGALRYELRGAALDLYCCHCLECRRQSASAFGISVILRSDDLVVTAGQPAVWTRPTRAGGTLACFFCPTCGSRLWHGDPARDPVLSVKGGGLDRPPDLTGAKHIWVSRKLPGVAIPPDAETWPEEPPAGA